MGTSTGFSIFSVAPLILYSIFLVCEAFHIKKSSWRLLESPGQIYKIEKVCGWFSQRTAKTWEKNHEICKCVSNKFDELYFHPREECTPCQCFSENRCPPL